jgi:hypothetical protein
MFVSRVSERLEMSGKDDRSGLPRPCHAYAHSSRIIPEIYLIGDRAKNPRIDYQEQARIEWSRARGLYRVMQMTFWLPQLEAALAQVEGC